jgi:protein-tyrosine phosphatase
MLTPRDYEYLAPLGIRVVCDLRTDYERKRMPTDWKAGSPEFLVAPVSDDRTITAAMQEMKRAIESGQRPEANRQPVTYSDMLFQYSGQYAKVFHRIASDAGPSLTHCSGGADRTGIYSAILLAALGVPRDTIMADYLLTRQFLGADPAAMAVTLQKLMDLDRPMDPAIQAKMMNGMTSNQMETMFAAIEGKYASVENLLKEGFGLTATEVQSLRDRLLEP